MEKNMKKFIGLLSLSSILFISACSVSVDTPAQEQDIAEETQEVEQNTVLIELIDGSEEVFIQESIDFSDGDSLMDVMKSNFHISEEGGFISSINEFEIIPEENIFLGYDINGEMGLDSADELILEDGDEILWKLMEF